MKSELVHLGQANAQRRSVNKEVFAARGDRQTTQRLEQRATVGEIMAISRRGRGLAVLARRSQDEIIGHDGNGLPR